MFGMSALIIYAEQVRRIIPNNSIEFPPNALECRRGIFNHIGGRVIIWGAIWRVECGIRSLAMCKTTTTIQHTHTNKAYIKRLSVKVNLNITD